jgi:hypothetical protein
MGWNKEDQFMLDTMDMLSAPIITYAPQWWQGGVPMKLEPKIKMDRMMYAMMKKEEATDSEVVGYLNTAASEFPLHHDWYEIYMDCFTKVFPEMGKQIDPEHRPLSEYRRTHLLNPLKKWLYKKRREIMKQRVRQYDKNKKTDFPIHVEVKTEGQLSLFN